MIFANTRQISYIAPERKNIDRNTTLKGQKRHQKPSFLMIPSAFDARTRFNETLLACHRDAPW